MTEATFARLARSINLRDIGGHPAANQRRVKRGLLYRSAALGKLTTDQAASVAELRLRAIVDLRHNAERAANPTPWEDLGRPNYWAVDHDVSRRGGLDDLLADTALTAEAARQLMVGVYQEMPYQQIEGLRLLFLTAARGEGPVLFHCTSGKDRTGVAAALILSVLGVPGEEIITDYLATLNFDILASPAYRHSPPDRLEALRPIYTVRPEYLDAMFDAIEARDGSVENFLCGTVKIPPVELGNLRDFLTE